MIIGESTNKLKVFLLNLWFDCLKTFRWLWSSLQTGSPYGLFRDLLSNGARSKARGQVRQREPAMVLVRFEYLHSDSERKLLIGQFDLTHANLC